VGILLILRRRVRASCGKGGVTHGSMEISDEPLSGGRTDTGAYDAPGRITKCNTRGTTVVMEVHTNAYPQGDFVCFDGGGQIVEKSGRRRDHGSDEDPKREGKASDGNVKRLGEGVLLRRVVEREPPKSLGEEKETVRQQDVFRVPSVREKGGRSGEVAERDV